jgi:hypothetical protein
MTAITRRKKVIAIILTILIWGLGHAYIGRTKRGVGLFFLGLAIVLVGSFLIPFPYSLLIFLAYLAWLIHDLLRIINLQNKQVTVKVDASSTFNKTCKKCGSLNPEDSVFCIKCGSALT